MSDQETKVVEGADAPMVDPTDAEPTTLKVEGQADTENTEAIATEAAQPEDGETTATTTTGPTSVDDDKPAEPEKATDSNGDGKTESASVSVRNPPKNMLGVRRPGKSKDDVEKNKFDPSVLGETSDPDAIRTQVKTEPPKIANE
jgi:hypothetical protein